MTLVRFWHSLVTHLHLFIAPPRCQGCTSLLVTRALLCTPCNKSIVPVVSTSLRVGSCVVPIFAVGAYQGILRRLICAKHAGRQIAGTHLGELIWYRTRVSTLDGDYLIPIPLHWTRKFMRGFNQADEMAYTLSRMSGTPVALLLKRARRTQFQTSLSAKERTHNVTDAFELARGVAGNTQYVGKHLVLVDDLMTTGATLRIACCELLKLKPASIVCVVAARTV